MNTIKFITNKTKVNIYNQIGHICSYKPGNNNSSNYKISGINLIKWLFDP